jgi:L-ribulose-5-phosphate 3-epimerase
MPPIVACHVDSYGPHGSVAAIENVRSAGLGWVELPIRTAGQISRFGDTPLVTHLSSPAEAARVMQMLADHGLGLSSCTCLSGSPVNPQNVELMKRKLDVAALLGCTVAVGDAGAANDDAERETIYDRLRELGDYAAALGMTLCLATNRGLCINHREILRVMADLNHPRVRISFDTAEMRCFNEQINGEVALAKSCHRVRHVVLKDSTGVFGARNFPTLGRGGGVDFLRIYQLIRDTGFRSPFVIRVEGFEGEGDLPLEVYHQRIVDSVKYLRELGFFDLV